jgi:hypothetical protein
MKRMFLLLILVAPSIGWAQMSADEISYSWIRVGWLMADFDAPGDDLDASGVSIDGSVEIRRNMHMFAAYDSLELDDFDVASQQRTFGIGAHFDIAKRISVFGQLGYVDIGADAGFASGDDDGARAIVGIRAMPWSGFELRGGVDHVELDVAGGDTGGFVGADLYLTDQAALTAEFTLRDDSQSLFFGGRIFFGGSR